MERREFIKIAGLGTIAITIGLGVTTTKGIILRFPSGEEYEIEWDVQGQIVIPVATGKVVWDQNVPLANPIYSQLVFSDSGVIENGWRIYKA